MTVLEDLRTGATSKLPERGWGRKRSTARTRFVCLITKTDLTHYLTQCRFEKTWFEEPQQWLPRKIITAQNLPDLEKLSLTQNAKMFNPENLKWVQELPGQAQPGKKQNNLKVKILVDLIKKHEIFCENNMTYHIMRNCIEEDYFLR